MSFMSLIDKIIENLQLTILRFNSKKIMSSKQHVKSKAKNNSSADTSISNVNTSAVDSTLNSFQSNSNNTNVTINRRSDLEPIKITDLVTPNFPELRDKVFENKEIWGPAVLIGEGGLMSGCSWDLGGLTKESAFISLSDTGIKLGIIKLVNCRFINCTFKGVAIATTPDSIADIRAGFR